MNLIKKLMGVLVLSLLVIAGLFWLGTVGLGPVNAMSYPAVIQRKFDYLKSVEEPKIILIGGSNLAFGIDGPLMEAALGRPVVNMGLHAGMGYRYNTEIVKDHINEGDVVILAYEYGWVEPDAFNTVGAELVLTGADHRPELLRAVPLSQSLDILDAFVDVSMQKVLQKLKVISKPSGIYSAASFDENGTMIANRPKPALEKAGMFEVHLKPNNLSETSRDYVVAFKEYVEDQGAHVYFTAPVFLETYLKDDEKSRDSFATYITHETGIPFISNPSDYLFDESLMFDTVYHCNSEGQRIRSERLIEDIRAVLP